MQCTYDKTILMPTMTLRYELAVFSTIQKSSSQKSLCPNEAICFCSSCENKGRKICHLFLDGSLFQLCIFWGVTISCDWLILISFKVSNKLDIILAKYFDWTQSEMNCWPCAPSRKLHVTSKCRFFMDESYFKLWSFDKLFRNFKIQW